ncbi:MAG TPA: DUF2256 domain-containing protein [Pyrinomonadaceae bacterium]|nr:DUF2256 domain-containing protein [Pyrinomonadaceae bacterium]
MAKKSEQKKYTKSNLPTKLCENCGKPMTWRKKWEKVWNEVKFCSEKCRRDKKNNPQINAD